MPELKSLSSRQDNAGCYHSASTILGVLRLSMKHNVSVCLDFSDLQGGNGLCVSSDMIRKIIEKAPPKPCPSHPIPTRLLKTCLVELRPATTNLVNSSLQTVVFPTAFKEGRILPKIKKITLDKEDFSNYRPVRNLPSLHKSTISLVSFAAVFRDVTQRSPERNGCSHSNHIPFPLCFKQPIKSVNCE